MKWIFIPVLFLLLSAYSYAQEGLIFQERKFRGQDLYFGFGLDYLANRSFSDGLESMGYTRIPTSNLGVGFGFSNIIESWRIVLMEVQITNVRRNFEDNPDLNSSFAVTGFKIGANYNIMPESSLLRVEPGMGIFYILGDYRLRNAQDLGDFDQILNTPPQFNELILRQNNYGLNVNVLINDINESIEAGRLKNTFSLELGTNIVVLKSRLRPRLTNAPDMNLGSFYFKVRYGFFVRN
ncbi:hypothetical protein [Pararhodonellum marinum]|uniref:hypothetical protein n=1 Tax=Pararhodonellum marinum TaxID=2755358 RepID=UPI00188E0C23|nr:hypothetical protein [Pararhodonellum marinum]